MLQKFNHDYLTYGRYPLNWVKHSKALKYAGEALICYIGSGSATEMMLEEMRYNKSNQLQDDRAKEVAFFRAMSLSTYGIEKMLFGLSLELILKGIRIAQDSTLVQETKIDQLIKNHCLVALFRDANIVLSEPEIKLVNVLSEYIVWAGRYPIPEKAKSDFKDFTVKKYYGSEMKYFGLLYERLEFHPLLIAEYEKPNNGLSV